MGGINSDLGGEKMDAEESGPARYRCEKCGVSVESEY